MPRDGTNGLYSLPNGNPVEPETLIESTWANVTMDDLATAITQSIAKDGQTTPISNLPMGGYNHTNVSPPTLRNQYSTLGMVQDGLHQRIQSTTGVDNITGSLVGGATVYVAGALVSFYAPGTNTGPMTLSYNGIPPKSLIDSGGDQLHAGDIQAGQFLIAIYNGNEFQLISELNTEVPVEIFAPKASGQTRPASGTFPVLTIVSGTVVGVAAGTAWIVPPNIDDAADAVLVSWATQNITMQYLGSAFSTTIAVNSAGQIIQIAGRASGAQLRNYAILGAVEHIAGVVAAVSTRPTIFGDDLYRLADTATMLSNFILTGGKITGNTTNTLRLDISSGTIFLPGGSSNTIDNPNSYQITGATQIPLRPLYGSASLGTEVLNVPVTQYDPAGAGTLTTIPNNGDAVVHRVYFLYGRYIWVYGQYIYTSLDNAMAYLEFDRSRYKPSLYLSDATLVAEIIALKSCTNLNLPAQAIIVAPGSINFSIGSAGGISEAPVNGTPYGRQDAGWASVLGATSPAMLVNAKITGVAPKLDLVMSPYSVGTVAYNVLAATFKWAALEVVNPDDKLYIRSYNPTNGNLRFSTEFNLATGQWVFPANVTAGTFTGDGSALTAIPHSGLTGLTAGDPHTQYLTQARGDARYPIRSGFTNISVVSTLPGSPDANTLYFVTT